MALRIVRSAGRGHALEDVVIANTGDVHGHTWCPANAQGSCLVCVSFRQRIGEIGIIDRYAVSTKKIDAHGSIPHM
jgi:hypothetical protein